MFRTCAKHGTCHQLFSRIALTILGTLSVTIADILFPIFHFLTVAIKKLKSSSNVHLSLFIINATDQSKA